MADAQAKRRRKLWRFYFHDDPMTWMGTPKWLETARTSTMHFRSACGGVLLGALHSLSSRTGLSLLIVQQPFPGGREKAFLDENPDFGLKTPIIWDRPRNINKAKGGLFRGKVPKTDSQHPFFDLNFQTSSEQAFFSNSLCITKWFFWMKRGLLLVYISGA